MGERPGTKLEVGSNQSSNQSLTWTKHSETLYLIPYKYLIVELIGWGKIKPSRYLEGYFTRGEKIFIKLCYIKIFNSNNLQKQYYSLPTEQELT